MLEPTDSNPSLVQARALVDLRNDLVISMHGAGLKPAELSYVFNIQRQLINHIINNRNRPTDNKQT